MKTKLRVKKVVVIGGFDPSGGAGVLADLETLNALNVPAVSVITAVTAQNHEKFLSYQTLGTLLFKQELLAIEPLEKESIVKIGMLGHVRLIAPLVDWLKKIRPAFVILDPVFYSSTGHWLFQKSALSTLKKTLLRHVDLITPNLFELELLTKSTVADIQSMEHSARLILKDMPQTGAVLAKGGHLKTEATDLLVTPQKSTPFSHPRLKVTNVHGTGCTLSSAIAGYLFLGNPLEKAIDQAISVVLQKIKKIVE